MEVLWKVCYLHLGWLNLMIVSFFQTLKFRVFICFLHLLIFLGAVRFLAVRDF